MKEFATVNESNSSSTSLSALVKVIKIKEAAYLATSFM